MRYGWAAVATALLQLSLIVFAQVLIGDFGELETMIDRFLPITTRADTAESRQRVVQPGSGNGRSGTGVDCAIEVVV